MLRRGLRVRHPYRPLGGAAVRRVLAGLAAAALALALALLPTPARADEQPTTAAGRFGACLASGKQGDLLLLVDESASLKTNDPGKGRVAASEQLMRGLAALAAQGVTVDVRIDTFATAYANGAGWATLNEAALPGVLSQVAALAGKENGTGTDYWLALDGARMHLAEKAAGGPRCQAVLFFSDGEMDIDRGPGENDYNVAPRPYDPGNKLRTPADRAQANARATESLCRAGGLADQLRSSGVALFGIGLQGPNPGKFDLMRGIVTGRNTAGACGAVQDPVPGDFYLATGVGDLLLAFDQVTRPGRITERDVCQGDVCPQGAHAFVLDASVGRVEVLATSSGQGPAPQVVVIDPAGRRLVVPPGTSGVQKLGLPGTNATAEWLEPRSTRLVMARDGSQTWTGQWQVVFVDPTSQSNGAKSKTSLRIVGDLRPAWVEQEAPREWRQGGDPVRLQIGLVDGAGKQVPATSVLGSMRLSVDVVTAAGTSKRLATLDQSSIAAPVVVRPDDLALDTTTLSLVLDVTTRGTTDPQGRPVSGTALATQRVDVPVSVLPPLGYPSVAAAPVQFGRAEGPARLSAAVTVTGGGCVWLPDGTTQVRGAPDGVTDIAVSSTANAAGSCVKVADGQRAELPVTLTTGQAGNGGVTGEMTVWFAPREDPSQPRQVQVPFQASLVKPLNQTNFLLVLIAGLLLGPGIPLALLYLFRHLVAARIPGESLLVTPVSVSLGSGGRLLREGAPLAPQPGDLSQILPGTGRPLRSVDVASGVRLRTRTGWSPIAAPYVVAETPGAVAVSDTARAPEAKTGFARLPVAVQNHWLLVQRHDEPADRATLVLIAGASASAAQRQELYDSAAARAEQSFTALAAARPAGGAENGPAATPFGSGPVAPVDNPFGGATQAPPPGSAGPDNPFGGAQTTAAGGPFGAASSGDPFGTGRPATGQATHPAAPAQPAPTGPGQAPTPGPAPAAPVSAGDPFGMAPQPHRGQPHVGQPQPPQTTQPPKTTQPPQPGNPFGTPPGSGSNPFQ